MSRSHSNKESVTLRELLRRGFVFLRLHKVFDYLDRKTDHKFQNILGVYPYINFDEYLANKKIYQPLITRLLGINYRHDLKHFSPKYSGSSDLSVGFRIPPKIEDYMVSEIKSRSSLISHADVVETISDRVNTHIGAYKVRWPGESPTGPTQALKEPDFQQIPIHVMLIPIPVLNASIEDDIRIVRTDLIESNIDTIKEEIDYLILYGDGQGKMQGYYPKDQELPYKLNTYPDRGIIDIQGELETKHLEQLKQALPSKHKPKAHWIMSAETGYKVATLRDEKGELISIISEVNDLPNKVLGIPVIYNDYMDDPTGHNSVPVILADVNASYTIGIRPHISIRRFDDSAFAEYDQVLFLSRYRIGGQMTDPDAVRMLRIIEDGFVDPTKAVKEAPTEDNVQTMSNVGLDQADPDQDKTVLTINKLEVGSDKSREEVEQAIKDSLDHLTENITGNKGSENV